MAIVTDTLSGEMVPVLNLGWLIRHAADVRYLAVEWSNYPEYGEVFLRAQLTRNREYGCFFADRTVCREWLRTRRSLRGLPLRFLGEEIDL